MSHGRIQQLDAPNVIYDRPLTAFVADFIGEMNFLEGPVTKASQGEFEVDAGAGVVVRARGDIARGTSARVGIRPARLRIVSGEPDGRVNTAHGVAVTKVYLGDEVQVVADLEDGTRMLIREQRAGTDASHDAIRAGDPITIQWDTSAPVLLADPPPTRNDRGDHD
jgi:ABC-type Fe3+/spermidine/putrescine transport system ATPase subunit